MSPLAAPIVIHGALPGTERFRADVLAGLSLPQKAVPSKYLYDERGSLLFDRICEQDEYYVARTETAITVENAGRIASLLGPRCLLVEFGSGNSRKVQTLLEHMAEPAAYVPVDISESYLRRAGEELAERYPWLEVLPVCADFTEDFDMPRCSYPSDGLAVYFPGSTIGNFPPAEARALLRRIAGLCGRSGSLLIGVDLKKDVARLEAAYNDRRGVTGEFNSNILLRMNRELGATFRTDRFAHRAFYNRGEGRIEMHLVSAAAQTFSVGTARFGLRAGESIHTENSYKYSLHEFRMLAADAGYTVAETWTDPDGLFSVQFLTP